MINLRYHIVSLTAVFLALAIGVTMGTTFLNQETVKQLNGQIKSAEDRIGSTREENAALKREVDRAAEADDALLGSGEGLIGQLEGVPVLLLASEDIDGDSLDRLRLALVLSGADVRGTLTVTDRLRLDQTDEGEVNRLADVLEVEPDLRSKLQSELVGKFASALRSASTRPDESDASASAIVQRMIEADLLGYQPPPDDGDLDETTVLAGGGYRYVVVSGPAPRTPDADFLLPLLQNLGEAGPAPVVMASAAPTSDAEREDTRTASVGVVRGSTEIRDSISTVDDLESYSGLLATVLAVRDLDAVPPRRGHYGVGDGADRLLPESP